MRDLNLKTVVGDHMVSTVELGIDHGSNKWNPEPLWYETYIFEQENGEISNWLEVWGTRYTTEEQARAGHAAVVADLEEGKLDLAGRD